jgi:hypothetical protein
MTTIRGCLRCALGCIAALAVLTGCASTTATRIGTAATTPFADLNVTREAVPDVLLAALKNPYQLPASQNCVALSLEIRALDDVLGADLDAAVSPTDLSLVHRASSLAQDQAVGALQRTAEGLIPFRGWVRKLSGAERHSKHVSACIAAGSVRRAFLKGFAAAQNCPWRDAVGAVATR